MTQRHTSPANHPRQIPQKGTHQSDRSLAPVRQVTPGQLGINSTRGSTPPNPTLDLPICSTYSNKTLGIVGTPHGHSTAKLWSTKTRWIKRNRRISAKNTPNPKTTETPKSSPYSHGFGRGIKEKRTTKGSCIHPPTNPQANDLEISRRKSPSKGSENHQKGKSRRTQTSLEEPRRIIYIYHEGSYKV
jgi:hypothetical protein